MINLSKFLSLLRINSQNRHAINPNITYMNSIFNLKINYNYYEIYKICTEEPDQNEGLNLQYEKFRIPSNIDELANKVDNFDAYILKWPIGSVSPPHQHPEKGCFMKILDGNIQEELYRYPFPKLPTEKENLIRTKYLYYDDCSFIAGNQTHIIKNFGYLDAYTVHIYGK